MGGLGTVGRAPAERADFSQWLAPHWSAMALLARRLAGPDEADDVLQEALRTAWEKRARFDAERGTPRAWLLALVADFARRSRRRRRPWPVAEAMDAGVYDRPVDIDLERAIGRLARRQRVTVELHYILDLPVAEVAEVLGCSVGTVKSTLSDARARLRLLLGDHHD